MDFSLFTDIHVHHPAPFPSIQVYGVGCDTQLPLGEYTAGIHPWHVCEITSPEVEKRALRQAITSRCVGIGEIGLDFFRAVDSESRQQQLIWFEWQMEVAARHALPVVIHAVRSHHALLPVLQRYRPVSVLHGFVGTPETAAQLLRVGCSLSVGERSLRSSRTREVIRTLPAERLFIESDESTRAIETLYHEIAALRAIPTALLQETIYQNYLKTFHPGKQ